ncbi:MAG: hypothetical protein U9R79_09910 [Armatimonadota bacterium]|nr:hypothetical protein [Armatimonadota bacterium]
MRTARSLLLAAVVAAAVPALRTEAQEMNTNSESVIVTPQMRANAIANCRRFDWARSYRDRLIAQVEPWMDMSDEQLWRLLPSQQMPRDSGVNRGDGCPNCGQEHYKAPYSPSRWRVDFFEHPWKVRCANCDQWFPANDFAAYYRSALDEQGKFRLGAGDPRYLQPAEGLPAEWVDDGTGVEIDGKKWFFAANYAFRLWQKMLDVTEKMAVVYTLTEDPVYAHKAGVLLDRMADLYPEMDYMPHYRLGMEASTGGSGRGRIQGKIWETWTAQKLSLAYDHIHDALMKDQALVEFSSRMAAAHGTGDKSSPEAIEAHIEDHLLREFIAGVLDGRIRGNPGMHQYAMACAAIALDEPQETEDALDWLFDARGGALPYVLQERLGREGFSNEAALGYSRIPARTLYRSAELLNRYARYRKHDLIRDYPKFRNCYTMCAKVRMIDTYTPNWGDGDKCMNFGTTGMTIPVEMALQGYRIFGTPEIGRELWFANGKGLDNVFAIRPSRGNVAEHVHFHLYEESPEEILADLREDLAEPPGPLASYNSGGYGQAVLQAPWREEPRALGLYYGRMGGHGHHDRLNYLLVAHNVVNTPDMGYPLYCTSSWKKRFAWTDHVISHNTCMVNETTPDDESYSGKTRLFDEAGPVRVADIDGGEVYEGVSTFRRCMVMVDADEARSYVLDLFWVRGGTNHRLIQNGGGPEVTHSGLELIDQPTGTYAGPDVEFGEEYDGQHTSQYAGTGFSYLRDVQRAQPEGDFWVDWRLVEPRREMPEGWEAHLRVHSLSPVDEVALCTGVPPRFKGNPESLRYLLRSRFGEGLSTQFISILEPYAHEPFITGARVLRDDETPEGFVAAVEVELTSGARDVLLVAEREAQMAAGGATMHGRVGLCRFRDGEPETLALIQGTRLAAGGEALTLPSPAIRGRLAGWDDSDPARVLLHLDPDAELPDEVVGKYIIIDNEERSDASFRIEEVLDADTISIGQNSLVERFVDRTDYSKGLIYLVQEGNAILVPLSAFAADDGGARG